MIDTLVHELKFLFSIFISFKMRENIFKDLINFKPRKSQRKKSSGKREKCKCFYTLCTIRDIIKTSENFTPTN